MQERFDVSHEPDVPNEKENFSVMETIEENKAGDVKGKKFHLTKHNEVIDEEESLTKEERRKIEVQSKATVKVITKYIHRSNPMAAPQIFTGTGAVLCKMLSHEAPGQVVTHFYLINVSL